MAELSVEQQKALALARARRRAAEAKAKEQPKPKPQAKPRQQGFTFRGAGPLNTTLDVINEAILGGVEGAYNLGAMVTDPIAGLFASEAEMEAARRQRRNFFSDLSRTFATQDRPIAREIGRTVAPAGAVGRIARMAAPLVRAGVARVAAPKVAQSAERVTRAVGTGGLGSGRTAAQTAAMPRLQRLGQLGERMVGGGLGAGATAALMGQDLEGVGTAGAFGAGLPVVASILKRLGGFAGDITQMPRQKAAQIIRKSLGDNVDAARAEFARLSPEDRRLAEQVLVDAEIEPDTFFGLGRIAQEQLQPPGVNPMRTTLEAQAAAREARLAEAAGGPDMESIRAAERQGRQAVTEAMAPIREAMYGRAGVASRIVPEAEAIAQAARARADEITESGFVPRMRGLEERAAEQAELMGDMPAIFPDMERIQQTRGIAGAAGQRADDAIAAQIGLRGLANDMYDVVDDLAAEGMQPMRAVDLIGSLRQKMRDPEILAGSMEERVIKNVIRQIEKGTDANGMLNPRTLGKIRRSGLNEIVQKLSTQTTGGPSRTGTPEAAQDVVLGLRNMIDDTLRRGGAGDLVDQFIQGSERGYAAVNRQRLAGEALRLYKQEPKTAGEFLALMGRDRPETVSKFMKGGPEKETIAGAFAGDPQRLNALQQSAGEMKTLNRMNELREAGVGPAGMLLREQRPSRVRALAAATMSTVPSLRIGATGAEETVKNIMLPRVQRQVGEAFTSGQAMNRMLNTFPGAARISDYVSRLPAEIRNVIAQSIINQALPEIDLPSADEGLQGAVTYDPAEWDAYGNYIGPR
jgi:hypothetical protein